MNGDSTDQIPDIDGNATGKVDDPPSEWEQLAALDIGTEVMVKRTAPDYAKGWLASVDFDGAGESGLLEKIRTRHGGGTFLLQPKARASNGSRLFSGGSIRIDICGFPVVDGQRCGPNGPLIDSQPAQLAPPMQMAPMGYPPPYQPPDPGLATAMQTQMMGMIGKALQKGDASIDLAGVIGALNQLGVTAQPAVVPVQNPLEQIRQTMELAKLLREDSGGENAGATEKPDRLGQLMEIAAMKFMQSPGGDNVRQPPQPQRPTRPQANPVASHGPATAQPSPNHVWHPSRGWVLWSGGSEAPSEEPVAGVDQPSAAGDRGFVGHPHSPPSVHPTESESDYVTPIEPDELVGELQAKTPEERIEFIRALISMVQGEPELQSAFMAGVAGAEQPDESTGPGMGNEPPAEE